MLGWETGPMLAPLRVNTLAVAKALKWALVSAQEMVLQLGEKSARLWDLAPVPTLVQKKVVRSEDALVMALF